MKLSVLLMLFLIGATEGSQKSSNVSCTSGNMLNNSIKSRILSFCQLFIYGGTCEPHCEFEAVHKWGEDFHLCPPTSGGRNKCCIPLSHPLVQLFLKNKEKSKSTTTSTTTSATTTSTQLPISTESLDIQSQKRCGISHKRSRVRRVVGGKSAPSGAWPWQVAIRTYTGHYVCGGVLLTSQWVLTAAHCFEEAEDSLKYHRVYMGDQTLSFDHSESHRVVKIAEVIRHEQFERNVNVSVDGNQAENVTILRHVNDIALIRLAESVEFTDNLEPICLPDDSSDLDPEDCWVTGWGETGDTEVDPVKKLQEVQGHLINSGECSQRWGTNFTDDDVCFGSEGRGPCKGDSGSGMTCRHPDGRFRLVGIVSWGREDCIHDDHPSVLTNVGKYRDWIDSHLLLSN